MSLQAAIESIIFASDSPVSIERLAQALPEYEREEIRKAMKELISFHEKRGGGFLIVEVAGGWQFRTDPDYHEYVLRILKSRPIKFSNSSLETLAMIAYRQPVTRSEVEYLRGVDCGAVLKTLLERSLIRIMGKKDIPGRPIIYGTTGEFLKLFGLKDLKSLPTLRELQALDDEPLMARQEELPLSTGRNVAQDIQMDLA